MSGATGTHGLKRLDDRRILPGDIILVTSSSKLSAVIRLATRSDISHAMVCVEARSVIDATGEGVQARNLQRLFLEEACPVHVLRLRDGLSPSQLDYLRNFLRSHIGTRYSNRQAAMSALGGARQWDRKQFCSRLIAQAYEAAGIKLVRDPNFCSPGDIRSSKLLEAVSDATVSVSASEAAFWAERDDVPQKMRDAINVVLGGARRVDPTIETFDDLHRHLVSHPERDDEMCRLLETSGYLSIWKIEQEKNPWQYDLANMNSAPDAEIENYCWSVLANEDGGPNRYVVNRGAYTLFARQHDLQFFRTMADLYELLATLHRQRVEVAAQWLQSRGHLTEASSPALIPHSEEWFEGLTLWNPAQAQMARVVIDAAGHTDVCTVCGDEPVNDYRLEKPGRPTGGPDTLRLCEYCARIRRENGEPFVLLGAEDEPARQSGES